MDGSKEQTQGEFARKCEEADCLTSQTLPYSPWMNAAERGIKELKRAAARTMVAKKVPKQFWDDCTEREAIIRSHTALDIHKLQGEVPETFMLGQTADISRLAEFGFYDW